MTVRATWFGERLASSGVTINRVDGGADVGARGLERLWRWPA